MGTTAQMLALVRRGTRSVFGGVSTPQINSGGDLAIAQCLPIHTELTRLGTRWSAALPTGSAFTFGAAPLWPTTNSLMVLYNAEPVGGKSYVIDTIWGASITSVAVATAFSLLAQVNNTGVAAPSNNTAVLRTGTSGKIYAGAAKLALGDGTFAVASKWEVVGVSGPHPSTTIGAGCFADVLGRYILPPSGCLCINLVANTNAGTGIVGVDWYEVQLDLGP